MIKQLLLTGAFALSIFSASFAQKTVSADSGYYSMGDVNAITNTGTGTPYGTPTAVSGGVEISVNATAANYNYIGYTTGFAFPKHADTLRIVLSTSSSATIPVRVALKDANGYITDNIASFQVTSTPTLYTMAFKAADFADYYSPVTGGSCTPPASGSPGYGIISCPVDSMNIAQIQVVPNPGNTFTGTLTIGYVYVGDSAAITKPWPALGPAKTVTADSGYYTRGNLSVFGNVGGGTPYTTGTDASGNVTIAANIPAGNGAGEAGSYPPLTISLTPSIALPKHADSVWLYLSASQNVPLRVALQDAKGYTADVLSPVTVTGVPTLFKIPLPASAFTEANSTPGTGNCTTNPCPVDSATISEIQLLPNPGSPYTGTITIGYIYIGDSTAVSRTTAITAANPIAPTVNVYPNPIAANSGLVTINDNSAPSYNITLTNSVGAVVATSAGTTVNAPTASGMYFITYSATGGVPKTLPLVVK